jgi:hypothetical protein
MSIILNTIFRLLPVSLIGLLLNRTIIKIADDETMFDGMIILFIVVLFILAFAWTLYKDNKVYRMTQSKISYIPTSIGILFIASFFITNSVLAARDKSPILIQAGYDGGFNGAWFEFREDGTYKFGNSGGIGATYSRGKYILKDSIITLDKSNIDNVIQSKLLAIRKTEMLDTTEQVVYQINSQHQVVDKDFKFIINIDKRKK